MSCRWTADELAFLEKHYADTTNRELAVMMCRNADSVSKKGREIGLTKSCHMLERVGRENAERATKQNAEQRRAKKLRLAGTRKIHSGYVTVQGNVTIHRADI